MMMVNDNEQERLTAMVNGSFEMEIMMFCERLEKEGILICKRVPKSREMNLFDACFGEEEEEEENDVIVNNHEHGISEVVKL